MQKRIVRRLSGRMKPGGGSMSQPTELSGKPPPLSLKPVNNVFAQASASLAQVFHKQGLVGADFSKFRVESVSPDSSRLRHAPAASPSRLAGPPDGKVFALAGTNYLAAAFWPETREI